MRFEIVVAPQPSDAGAATAGGPPDRNANGAKSARGGERPDASARGKRDRVARDLLEVFVDGANVTSRVHETHGVFVLRDLALALTDLGRGTRAKAAVRFYDEPWEMCIERFGAIACVSVYRTGADPQVTVYDRGVPFDDVSRSTWRIPPRPGCRMGECALRSIVR